MKTIKSEIPKFTQEPSCEIRRVCTYTNSNSTSELVMVRTELFGNECKRKIISKTPQFSSGASDTPNLVEFEL